MTNATPAPRNSVHRAPAYNAVVEAERTGYSSRPAAAPNSEVCVSFDEIDGEFVVWASAGGAMQSRFRRFYNADAAIDYATDLLHRSA